MFATLAQLVEQRIRNAQVSSSILLGGSTMQSVDFDPSIGNLRTVAGRKR